MDKIGYMDSKCIKSLKTCLTPCLSIAVFLSASLHVFNLNAQETAEEEMAPSNPGIASPTEGDNLAMQGMRVEEGLGESEPEGPSEAQKSFIDNKAQEDEEIKKEEADAQLDVAETQEVQAESEPVVGEVEPVESMEPEVNYDVNEVR